MKFDSRAEPERWVWCGIQSLRSNDNPAGQPDHTIYALFETPDEVRAYLIKFELGAAAYDTLWCSDPRPGSKLRSWTPYPLNTPQDVEQVLTQLAKWKDIDHA